ncbi:MAG: DUF3794 domain-containing protein [Clostridia bacterium]|nr:DUF3794 domain-containing protein [Clostridia bacterium]
MNTTLYIPRLHTTAAADVTEDVSLPDYVPEVRRIVGVLANPTVDGKYMTGDSVEIDGAVTYTVLYIGGDGGLAQVAQSTPYTVRIPADEDVSPAELIVSPTAEQISCRVTAPRKITLSSRVKLGAMAQKQADASMKTGEDAAVRRKTQTHTTAAVTEVRGTGEVSGEIREKEGTRLIMASAEIALNDVRVGSPAGKITVKGDVYLTALSLTPDGNCITSRSRAPVEEELALPDPADPKTCRAAAFGNIVLIEVDAGDDGVMQWRAEYDIDCDIMKITESETAADAYMIGWEDDVTFESAECCTPAGCVNGRLTTSASAKLRPGMTFVCAWGSVSGEKCSIKNGKMIVEGTVNLECVTAGEGETVTDEVRIPLRYECDAVPDATDSDSLMARVRAAVTDVTARPDGDTLNLTAELAISAAALGKAPVTYAASVTPKKELNEKKNLLRVYIPDKTETPWDVEKRFRLKDAAKMEGKAYVI